MALLFDAASDIDTSSGRPWAQNVPGASICAWVNNSALANGAQTVWGAYGNTLTTRLKMGITGSAGTISLRANALDSDATSAFNSTGAITQDVWAHIVGVFQFSSKSGIVYINGVANTIGQFANMTAGNTSNTTCNASRVGANEIGTANSWAGLLEDVRVYNRALGPNEVKTIYTEKGADGIWSGCQARWRMTETPNGVVLVNLIDISINNFGGVAGGTIKGNPGIIRGRRRPRSAIGHR